MSKPEVITHRDSKGKLLEPMEQVIIDVPEEYQGAIIQELSLRKGELVAVESTGTGLVRLEFTISTRGLIGYRSDFLTETRGLGVVEPRFTGYGPWKGDLPGRERGSLVSQTGGEAAGYSLENLQNRAVLFVGNMTPVYEGMIVGENSRADEYMLCNPTKRERLRQLPLVHQGDRRGSQGAATIAGIGARVDRRRRVRRGHAQDVRRAQAHPQHRGAQEVREARGRRGLTRSGRGVLFGRGLRHMGARNPRGRDLRASLLPHGDIHLAAENLQQRQHLVHRLAVVGGIDEPVELRRGGSEPADDLALRE